MNKSINTFALLSMIGLLFAVFAGCGFLGGSDDDDDPSTDSGQDDDISGDDDVSADDDVSGDDDASGGSMYSEQCDIDYGVDPGCDTSDPACWMVVLINEDRYAHPDESDCAQAIRWDADLAAVALAHSQDMCERGFFAHENPEGEDPFDRMGDAGIQFVKAGENIAMGTNLTVEQAEDNFMNEPECQPNHRGNILNRDFAYVGVGVYDCGSIVYITQDFATFDWNDMRDDPHEYCD